MYDGITASINNLVISGLRGSVLLFMLNAIEPNWF